MSEQAEEALSRFKASMDAADEIHARNIRRIDIQHRWMMAAIIVAVALPIIVALWRST